MTLVSVFPLFVLIKQTKVLYDYYHLDSPPGHLGHDVPHDAEGDGGVITGGGRHGRTAGLTLTDWSESLCLSRDVLIFLTHFIQPAGETVTAEYGGPGSPPSLRTESTATTH